MITLRKWDCTQKTCATIMLEDLPESASELRPDDVLWIDLTAPSPEEEALVFNKFLPVHSLTLEDITRPSHEELHRVHLSKVEEFPSYLFVIVNPLPPNFGDRLLKKTVRGASPSKAAATSMRDTTRSENRLQLSTILTHNLLLTHHYQPLSCVDEATRFLERHGNSANRGPDYLFHLILDAMVDEYAPVVDRVAARLDRLETRVFRDPSPRLLREMLKLKRIVSGLRKTLILEREVLARLTRGEFELVDDREIVFYRNVYDHLVRYTELIESAREMVGDLTQTHLSAVSNRLNEIMKVLAMISTIVLPMTLVAGVYGMNFRKGMPELDWEYGYAFALGVMLLTGITSFVLFRWRRWI